jgi:hypothetical protein
MRSAGAVPDMSSVKTLVFGIAVLVVAGVGGLVYRNAVERGGAPHACQLDAKVCPDGTVLSREGPACAFPACPAAPAPASTADASTTVATSTDTGP